MNSIDSFLHNEEKGGVWTIMKRSEASRKGKIGGFFFGLVVEFVV